MSLGTSTRERQPPDNQSSEIEILRALTDERDLKILRAGVDTRSAQEFSDLLDIPVEVCYRRLEELSQMGLLELRDSESATKQESKNVYRRDVNSVTATFDGEKLNVTVEDRNPVQNKRDDIWQTLAEDA